MFSSWKLEQFIMFKFMNWDKFCVKMTMISDGNGEIELK